MEELRMEETSGMAVDGWVGTGRREKRSVKCVFSVRWKEEPDMSEDAGTALARGLRLGLDREGDDVLLADRDVGAAFEDEPLLLASRFCLTMLWRKSGIRFHCPILAAFMSLVFDAALSLSGLVPGIFALGDKSEERKGMPPASTASLSHCSHSSSMTVAVLPASLCATAARNRSFSSIPTLWSSISLSSSISSSISFSSISRPSYCCISSISSTPALCA